MLRQRERRLMLERKAYENLEKISKGILKIKTKTLIEVLRSLKVAVFDLELDK